MFNKLREKIIEIDFFGDKRNYLTSREFSKEWNIKLLGNSQKECGILLKKMGEIFEKADEIDYTNDNGHFISKQIN